MADEMKLMFSVAAQVTDALANSDEGKQCIDNIGEVIGRLYRNLVNVQEVPEHAAAIIVGGMKDILREMKD